MSDLPEKSRPAVAVFVVLFGCALLIAGAGLYLILQRRHTSLHRVVSPLGHVANSFLFRTGSATEWRTLLEIDGAVALELKGGLARGWNRQGNTLAFSEQVLGDSRRVSDFRFLRVDRAARIVQGAPETGKGAEHVTWMQDGTGAYLHDPSGKQVVEIRMSDYFSTGTEELSVP
jgi:hypothetical protein